MDLFQAAIDGPVWSAVGVIVAAFVGLAIKRIPKTNTEASVDMAKVRLDDATSWQLQVTSLREEVQRLTAALKSERERADALEVRVAELEGA